MIRSWVFIFICVAGAAPLRAQRHKTENLVIVTLDGFRWQELFKGADSALLFSRKYVHDTAVHAQYWNTDAGVRREKLLPFIWSVVGTKGQLYGNRDAGNYMNCANGHWFSYPGYSELFTGLADRRVRSNDTLTNPNNNVLGFINRQPAYQQRVAAFSNWNVVPYILRARQTGLPVYTAQQLLKETTPVQSVEDTYGLVADAPVFAHAFRYLKKEQPRVLYISFDETDQHGHGGRYDAYLKSAHATDACLATLWQWLQTQDHYRDKTTLLITTDHGRGRGTRGGWKNHGRLSPGSGQVWMAVIGPDTPAKGEMTSQVQLYQKQFAKTVASFLDMDYQNDAPVGEIIRSMLAVPDVTAR